MKKVSNPALQVSLTAPLALRSMLHTRICNFLCVHSSHHHLQYAISFRYLSSVIPPDLQGCTRHSCFTRIKLFLGKGKKTSKYQTGGPYSPPSLSTSLLVALGRRSSAQANGSMHILCHPTPDPDRMLRHAAGSAHRACHSPKCIICLLLWVIQHHDAPSVRRSCIFFYITCSDSLNDFTKAVPYCFR